MSREIEAAVTTTADGPVMLERLRIAEPGPGEVLVELLASGICHTDFLAPQIVPLPAVLGHEGAGRVVAVGDGVASVAPGDLVAASYGWCGQCPRCTGGEMYHCRDFSGIQLGSRRSGSPALHRPDGTPVSASFFEQSSFATHAIMTERNVVSMPADIPPEYLAPLGCGVITGFGAVSNVLALRAGESLAVFGAGGVGLAAIMAAAQVGAGAIIAVDVKPARHALARSLGATHTVDGHADSVPDAIREIVPDGVDCVLETVGQAGTFNSAVQCARPGGRCAVVAVPNLGQAFELSSGRPLLTLQLTGVIEGRADPRTFLPRLAELIREGRLPMDRYVTRFPFAEINGALDAARNGEAAKAVVTMR